MAYLFENWQAALGDWRKSAVFVRIYNKSTSKNYGRREWQTKAQLLKKYENDEAVADLIFRKEEQEGQPQVRYHPDFPEREEAWFF